MSRGRFASSLLVAALVAAAPVAGLRARAGAQRTAPSAVTTKWNYTVVSTPDFDGPFRGSYPTFRAPVPMRIPEPNLDSGGQAFYAVFLVIVDGDGHTTVDQRVEQTDPKLEKQIREILGRWRFAPASFDGAAIRVGLRVTVYKTRS